MRARIVQEFHDKNDFKVVYRVDSLVDFPDSRFNELKALGLVVEHQEEEPKVKRERKKITSDD